MNRDEFDRHVAAATAATAGIPHAVNATQLLTEASRAAEQSIPGPVGVAVAGVLATEAFERGGLQCCCWSRRTSLALALAVLDHQLTDWE